MKRLGYGLVSIVVAVVGCGDTSSLQPAPLEAERCGAPEPEGDCNAITECVWTDETTSACLQICESTERDCEEGGECRRRLLRTSRGGFESTFVCFPEVEPADTPETQASRTALCAARPLESCIRSPECDARVATKLFLEDECDKLIPTDCTPHYGLDGDPIGQICMPSTWFATRADFPGDIFFFGSICDQSDFGFEGFYPQPDDPLYDVIYSEFPTWPTCF